MANHYKSFTKNDDRKPTTQAGVSDSAWLGQQTQLSLRCWPLPYVLVSSYLANFFTGDVIRDAGGMTVYIFTLASIVCFSCTIVGVAHNKHKCICDEFVFLS